ncbi:hypothetical protein OE88DRAFT_1807378 [Heliocybe sulcata]|uniref:C2H2-type domain-containing protein n=1 Tax=Heliocybe sulcata TaxID=5364 RepID=A0A5C3N4X8_9AGAM|nr:hypothetical protein OE88DRAFT_1807378 [Heliocybe sulcata]
MPFHLERNDPLSDDGINGLDDHGHWYSDKVPQARLQSFDGVMSDNHISDAESDDCSSDSHSEVGPYDDPHPPRYYQRAPSIESFVSHADGVPASYSPAPPSPTLLASDPPLEVRTLSESRRTTKTKVSYLELESDADSSGNDTDDEYQPSPPPKRRGASAASRRQRRSRHAPYPPSSASSSASSSPSSSSSVLPHDARPTTRSASRNVRATGPMPTKEAVYLMMCCPVCAHAPSNNRKPDLWRHVKTHFDGKILCCGYPEEVADKIGVRGLLILHVNGEPYRGGCGRLFKRSDSLKRHCDNVNVPCSGKGLRLKARD